MPYPFPCSFLGTLVFARLDGLHMWSRERYAKREEEILFVQLCSYFSILITLLTHVPDYKHTPCSLKTCLIADYNISLPYLVLCIDVCPRVFSCPCLLVYNFGMSSPFPPPPNLCNLYLTIFFISLKKSGQRFSTL